jgi:hypothetical protein
MNKLIMFRKLLKDFKHRWVQMYPYSSVSVIFAAGDDLYWIRQDYPVAATYKEFYSLGDLMDGLKAPIENLPRMRPPETTTDGIDTVTNLQYLMNYNPVPWDTPFNER